MAKRIRYRTKRIIITAVVFIALIAVAVIGVNVKNMLDYRNTYEFKLIDIGYTKENANILIDKLSDKQIDDILKLGLYDSIPHIVKEKYYMHKNINRYLEYHGDYSDKSYKDIVAIVNVGADRDWYTEHSMTDTSKGILLLVNKFNSLEEDYVSDDLVDISNWYSYGDNPKFNDEGYDKFITMFNDAKAEDINFFMTSPYRTHQQQTDLYNNNVSWYGKDNAENYVARPGFSEHQTGLAIDISRAGSTTSNFETFPEFTWLIANAYKYGFILRYPEGKEFLTGFAYESWHYRYVGVEAAKYIHENEITFDEYYAFYLEDK